MTIVGKRADPKFTRAMFGVIPFANAFARRGGDVAALLARNRIPPGVLSDPTMLVDAAACYAALEDMADTLGDPFFCASVAIDGGNSGTPAIRDAAANAVTFGDFLSRLVVEIARQVDNVRYRLTISSDAASLDLQRMIRISGPTTQVDAIAVTFHGTVIKRGLGDTFDPSRIVVVAATTEGVPPDFLPKRSLFESGTSGLRITFPPEWLWAPFSLGWQFGEIRRGEFGDKDGEGMIVHFRSVMAETIDQGELPLRRFADIVGLHPRRVQRILSANRTSFRQLKDDVRRDVALDLLSNTGTPIAEIAAQVGFSAVSAFDRAFKQWTGKTPTHVRKVPASHREG